MMWRFATAKLRCTPQIFVLGEVRCGTTTLASLLRDRLGLVGPFTPWVHPLANEKESFYFSGHYCGIIKPSMYSMCFLAGKSTTSSRGRTDARSGRSFSSAGFGIGSEDMVELNVQRHDDFLSGRGFSSVGALELKRHEDFLSGRAFSSIGDLRAGPGPA